MPEAARRWWQNAAQAIRRIIAWAIPDCQPTIWHKTRPNLPFIFYVRDSPKSKDCTYVLKRNKYFGAEPSGGNVLVPARTLRRSRLKGRCRKAAPLRIPRPQRRKCAGIFRPVIGAFIRNAQITGLSASQKVRKIRCHCEPSRRMVWQSASPGTV